MVDKIVIDTSVLINALIGKEGPGREILRRCLMGHYTPLISNALFHEYEDVTMRKHIFDLCPLKPSEIRTLLNAFYNTCQWIPIYYLWRPNLKDEDDNFLIELAIAGNSHYIITNDTKDLRNAELHFEEVKIVTPKEFLRGN